MKAIEAKGTVNELGQISLDKPLTIAKYSRVRVIVLITEENEEDNELVESASESFRQGWYDAMTGNTVPIS
ncbi:type II toxin-antitoxin system RelN family antitoxin [Nostoc sp.]|uniref:type II toxin-antitoxin system RelN family antitoxin n=1 Tax=Nostoc sp. TaxID=1180 RepID=UPI002FF5E7D0